MGVGLADDVVIPVQDRQVRPVMVCAVSDVLCLRQLLLQYAGGPQASVTQSKTNNPVRVPVYCPPQPDGVFLDPM